MNRVERAQRSRAAIVQTAADLFERQGFASTSLADVASQLGVVRGTIHFHFATKEGVAEAIVAHCEALLNDLASQDPGQRGPESVLTRFAEAYATDARVRAAIRLTVRREGRPQDDSTVLSTLLDAVSRTSLVRESGGQLLPAAALGAYLGLLEGTMAVDARAVAPQSRRFWSLLSP